MGRVLSPSFTGVSGAWGGFFLWRFGFCNCAYLERISHLLLIYLYLNLFLLFDCCPAACELDGSMYISWV